MGRPFSRVSHLRSFQRSQLLMVFTLEQKTFSLNFQCGFHSSLASSDCLAFILIPAERTSGWTTPKLDLSVPSAWRRAFPHIRWPARPPSKSCKLISRLGRVVPPTKNPWLENRGREFQVIYKHNTALNAWMMPTCSAEIRFSVSFVNHQTYCCYPHQFNFPHVFDIYLAWSMFRRFYLRSKQKH